MTAIATHQSLTDSDLVAASRQGDREAFGRIVRKYQGLVSGLIYSACGDLSASEDIAQETFLAAWKSLSGLREPQNLARSAPSAQFASAVVAALPALVAQSAAAGAAGGMAKASGAAKGIAALPFLAIWIGPIIGLMGGIFGTARSIRGTETPRERRF